MVCVPPAIGIGAEGFIYSAMPDTTNVPNTGLSSIKNDSPPFVYLYVITMKPSHGIFMLVFAVPRPVMFIPES